MVTPLRLDATSVMTPRVLWLPGLAAPDLGPSGRPDSLRPDLGFEVQTEKPADPEWPPRAGLDVGVCPASAESLLDLTDTVFITVFHALLL